MRYFVKKSTPSKKGLYLQIYKSYYVPGVGKKNQSHKALGYVKDLKEQGLDPFKYAQDMVDELNKDLKTRMSKQITDKPNLYNLGYFLPKAMFDFLDLDNDLDLLSSSYHTRYAFSDFIRLLTYAQIVEPGSKKYIFEYVIPTLYKSIELSYDQILDGLTFIGSDYHKYIDVLNHHISKKYTRNLEVALFDCTNYYFEIDREDEYRKRGPSKENRHDPIIGQALLLDGDMIPIDMELYPGNESERPYIRKRIEEMKSRNDVTGRIIQIADKGLNCARNIYAAVKEANDGYIFSKSVHGTSLSDVEKKWVVLSDDKANKWIEVLDENGNKKYKYKECIDEFTYSCKLNPDDTEEVKFKVKEKRIVTYNYDLAKKKTEEIERMVNKLQEKITAKDVIRDELGDSTKYVNLKAATVDGKKVKIAVSLNEEKIKEDKKLAGYNLLVTSEIDAKAIDIYNAYHNLNGIEQSFRIMKTQLEARPVHVSKKETIFGHFLIVYYGLVIMRLLEFKIFNSEIPVDQIFEFIRKYRITENFDGSFINNAIGNDTYKKIKDQLGLVNLGNAYLSIKDVEALLQTEF